MYKLIGLMLYAEALQVGKDGGRICAIYQMKIFTITC